MAIKYPGQTLQQYGRATVVDTGSKTLAAMSEANKLAATKQQQKAAAKKKAAVAQAKLARETLEGFEIKKDGVRPADLPQINDASNYAKDFFRKNSKLILSGDPQANADFDALKYSAEDLAIKSTQFNKQEAGFFDKYNANPQNYEQDVIDRLSLRRNTPIGGAGWYGDDEGDVGLENFSLQEIFDMSKYLRENAPKETEIEGINQAMSSADGKVQAYVTKFGAAPAAAQQIAANNYDQQKRNPSFMSQIKDKINDEDFIGSLDPAFAGIYAENKRLFDSSEAGTPQKTEAKDKMYKTIFSQMLHNAAQGKQQVNIVTPDEGGVMAGADDFEAFSIAQGAGTGTGTFVKWTRFLGQKLSGHSSSSILDITSSDADKDQYIQRFFGPETTWSGFSEKYGFQSDTQDKYHRMPTAPGRSISIQMPKGDATGASRLSGTYDVFVNSISEEGDARIGASMTQSTVNMTVADVRSSDIFNTDVKMVIEEGGRLIQNPTEKDIKNGFLIQHKKGEPVPSYLLMEPVTSQVFNKLSVNVPCVFGNDEELGDVILPLMDINNDGSLNLKGEAANALMLWFKTTLNSNQGDRTSEQVTKEYNAFGEALEEIRIKSR